MADDWLPDMDLNHDKQIQSLLCYRYTIGQTRPTKASGFALAVKPGTVDLRLNNLRLTICCRCAVWSRAVRYW